MKTMHKVLLLLFLLMIFLPLATAEAETWITVDSELYPESAHSYNGFVNETKTFTYAGAEQLELTFHSKTSVQSRYDSICIYDGQGRQVACYTGTQAAGKVLTVSGDTFRICMETENSYDEWGYAFTSIRALMGETKLIASGNCGDQGSNVTWKLYSDGVLSISGTGNMRSYSYGQRIAFQKPDLQQFPNFYGGSPFEYSMRDAMDSYYEALEEYREYMYSYICTAPWWENYRRRVEWVVIDPGVTSVSSYAFYGCTNLNSVILPNTIQSVSDSSFKYCDNLQYNTYQNGSYLGNTGNPYLVLMKAENQEISSAQIHSKAKVICNYAFSECSKLKTVTIPDSVVGLGKYAFQSCTSLTSVQLGAGITTIQPSTFRFCTSLTSIQLPAGVTAIQDSAFRGCTKLATVALSEQLNTIEQYAFSGCTALQGLQLPDSLKNIGEEAFCNCSSLTKIRIPNGIQSIGSDAFSGCSKLQYNIYDNAKYLGNDENPYLFLESAVSQSIPSVQVHSAAKYIGTGAFRGCTELTNVSIPDGVEIIERYAFEECDSMTNLVFPKNIQKINGYVVFNCGNLISVSIPEGVTEIDEDAFNECRKLAHIYFAGSAEQWSQFAISTSTTISAAAVVRYHASPFAGIQILEQPQSVTSGSSAVFHVRAAQEDVTYQWQYRANAQKSWNNSSSATQGYNTDTLTVVAAMSRDGYQYRCKITDSKGYIAFSYTAQLTVEQPSFAFVAHPLNETVKLGNRAAFTVECNEENVAYQWQYQMVEKGPWWNCTQYTMGYNTTVLNVIAAEKRQGFLYRCRVTDALGNKFYSQPAELTVDIPEQYAVLSQPKDAYVMADGKAVFHVDTQGENLQFQWEYHKGVDKSGSQYYWIPMGSTTGCKTDTLTVAAITGSTNRDGWAYRCVVTDADGYIITTEYAFLHIVTAYFTAQPESQNTPLGSYAVFRVGTVGKVASYQWQYSKNGGETWFCSSAEIQGHDTNTLTIEATEARDGYLYRCVMTDRNGIRMESDSAQLRVRLPESNPVVAHPVDAYVMPISMAVFHVDTQGTGLQFRWEYNNVSINNQSAWTPVEETAQGYNTDTLTVPAVSGGEHHGGWAYRCIVIDQEGFRFATNAAYLYVTAAQLTAQPQDQSLAAGGKAVFQVATLGKVASYQWQYSTNGGATWYNSSSATQGYNTATLTVEATAARNGFLYRCILTDANGNRIESQPAMLTVK